jgi:hypothetical protein
MTPTDTKSGEADGPNQEHTIQSSTPTSDTTPNPSKESIQREDTGYITVQEEKASLWRRIYTTLTWTPPNCRWNPDKPPQFSMAMNVLFAFSAGFTVANLYYSHPILNLLADAFGVRYEQVSQIPTVMQAGYAAGLLFLCPLGDLLPRRPFVVGLVGFTATIW